VTDAELPAGRTVSRRASEIHHGTPGGYRKGCRCRKCTRAKSAQRAEERARKRARDASAAMEPDTGTAASETTPPVSVTEPPADATAEAEGGTGKEPGQVEAAVIAELELHEGSRGVPPLAAVAVALAQEIDEAAGTSVAGAARQLVATLSEIRKLSAKTDDELSQLLAAMKRA